MFEIELTILDECQELPEDKLGLQICLVVFVKVINKFEFVVVFGFDVRDQHLADFQIYQNFNQLLSCIAKLLRQLEFVD